MKSVFVVLIVVFCLFNSAFAAVSSADIDAATAKVMPQVIEWRRFIHQHPELGNREFNTSKLIAEQLQKLGIEVKTGIAKTGVVGILKGGQPGPVVGLRPTWTLFQ